METIFYYVIVPLIILGIAINIHEFGHYIVGRIFGMRIEAYSFFGLGPRIWGFKRGHTDYRISAIPLGAYVKFYGDEGTAALEGGSSDGEPVPESELFELRPRWQKFFVMLGGPAMNIFLALAIPFGMALYQGVPAVPSPIVGAIAADGAAARAGIKVGDRVVGFNGIENPTWKQIEMNSYLLPEMKTPIVIERGSERLTLDITPKAGEISGQRIGLLGMEVDTGSMPVVIGTVQPNTPASEAGLQPNDRIVAINGESVRNSQTVLSLVQQYKANPIKLTIEREGKLQDLTATVRKLDDGTERLGISFTRANIPLETATLSTAWSYAVTTNLDILRMTGTALGQVFTGNRSARDTVSGPVGIFKESANAAKQGGVEGAIIMLMMISLSLGVFNLLPIPMLDGGQIMVLGIEKVLSFFNKTLSMVARERIQLTGLAIVLLLMVTVMFFDISKLIGVK
jgi:regulator of sigma E protease